MRTYSSDLYFLTTITPLHVGVGRTVGSVDLPVARDGFGYPYVPGSSIKGVVKSKCMLRKLLESGEVPRECTVYYGVDSRSEESISEEEVWVSPVSFTDAYLLLYPIRVEKYSSGEDPPAFAYATSNLLVSRYNDFVENLSIVGHDLLDFTIKLDNSDPNNSNSDEACGDLIVNNVIVREGCRKYYEKEKLSELLGGLVDIIKNMGKLDENLLNGGVYVFDDKVFREIVEAGIIRQTRIRLDYKRKAVMPGALWSEEYVSQGAVFYFASIYRSVKTRNCIISADDAKSRNRRIMLDYADEGVLVIGGKETVGKGLVRIKIAG